MANQNRETCVNSRFMDNYDLKEVLGKGDFYIVRRAVQKSTAGEFAVKIMNIKKISAKNLKKIENEVRICRKLPHPNIVKIHSTMQDDLNQYILLDLATGGELFEDIVTRQSYSEADVSHCMKQILEAVNYCHQHGVVHKDIKPENILLVGKGKEAVVKLAEFGSAVEVQRDQDAWFGIISNLGYVAPEAFKKEPYGKPVDIWACGVILYVLLVGYYPFSEKDMCRLYTKVKAGHVDYSSPEWDTVSQEAKILINRMLTINPKKRVTAAEALRYFWIYSRERAASDIHRQETVERLKKFNARRKLKGAIVTTVVATGNFSEKIVNNEGDEAQVKELTDDITIFDDDDLEKAKGVARTCCGISEKHDDEALTKADSFGKACGDSNVSLLQAEIIKITEVLIDAFNNSDYETYSKLCDPDVTAFDPGALGNLAVGVEFHKFVIDNTPTFEKTNTTLLNPRVHLLGDDVAVIAYVCVTRIVDAEGRLATRQSQETRIWRKRHNKDGTTQWTVIHFHRS